MRSHTWSRSSIMLVVVLLFSSSMARAQSPDDATASQELYATIAESDTALFEAFNTCDLARFAAFFVENPEFYHDKTGLETSRQGVVDAVKENICGKVRRELVRDSLEVYPIPNYGAVETGVHRFYEVARGKDAGPVGIAKFLQIWQKTSDGWKVSRVVSYDHRAAE
jgi:hypothetical protein